MNENTLLGYECIPQLNSDKSIGKCLCNVQSSKIIESMEKVKLEALLHKYQDITSPSIFKISYVQRYSKE